jgi:hypothetical protein
MGGLKKRSVDNVEMEFIELFCKDANCIELAWFLRV